MRDISKKALRKKPSVKTRSYPTSLNIGGYKWLIIIKHLMANEDRKQIYSDCKYEHKEIHYSNYLPAKDKMPSIIKECLKAAIFEYTVKHSLVIDIAKEAALIDSIHQVLVNNFEFKTHRANHK